MTTPATDIVNAPVVSVIVPAYNAARYIGDALDSLLAQTLHDIEIIVINDGSTDATKDIAEEYAQRDGRVCVISRERSSGRPASARNAGIGMARGEFIALLDADDIAVPTRLEQSIQAMRASGASLAFADFQKFDDGDRPETPLGGYLEGAEFVTRAAEYFAPVDTHTFLLRQDFLAYMFTDAIALSVQTVVFARNLIAPPEVWFDESFLGGEDLDLFYRLAAKTRLVFVNQIHTLMRVHHKSLTATHRDRCAEDAAMARRINLERVEAMLPADRRPVAREAVSNAFFDIGQELWERGQRHDARPALRESWRLHRSCRTAKGYVKTFVPRELLLQIKSGLALFVGMSR
jgi:GT2 family glycosyltransferase